ncbi:MAG: ATP-dependent helicase [Helicobacteraceae bacterium]|nr:ATP-dependent helicase [Helicobacteraceae bacterium]
MSEKIYYDPISVTRRTSQVIHFVEQHDKEAMLEIILHNNEKKQTLIIMKSKKSIDILSRSLSAKAVHGNHKNEYQQETVSEFNSKKIDILITTDAILKTLELKDVELVVSFDLPLSPHEYFNRVVFLNEKGNSIIFLNEADETLLDKIEYYLKEEIQAIPLDGFVPTKAPAVELKSTKKKKARHRTKNRS